ncbi:hypothetical protein YC2023_052412 [Brassica napus]
MHHDMQFHSLGTRAKTKDLGLRGLPLQHNNGFISTTKVPRTSPRKKPRLFTGALDFSQVGSENDAELLYEAPEATK